MKTCDHIQATMHADRSNVIGVPWTRAHNDGVLLWHHREPNACCIAAERAAPRFIATTSWIGPRVHGSVNATERLGLEQLTLHTGCIFPGTATPAQLRPTEPRRPSIRIPHGLGCVEAPRNRRMLTARIYLRNVYLAENRRDSSVRVRDDY